MGLIQTAKDKVREKQEQAIKKATDDMTKFILNEVKKEINPRIEEVAEKINRRAIAYQTRLEKQIQGILDKQTEHFNQQLEEQGPILKKYIDETIKEKNI